LPFIGIVKKQGRFSITMQWNELTVISCYIFPNVDDTIYEEFLNELDDGIQEAGKDLIIGGDFNSKSVLWGCKHDNIRGDRLARWCASRDMILVNIGNQPTCVRPQGTSIVDVTWSNSTVKSRITQWIVLEDETLSDHKYISFVVITDKNNCTVHRKKKYVRWAYKKFNNDMYKEALEWSCMGQTPELDVGKAAKLAQEALTTACDYSMPRAKPIRKDSVYWWNPIIAELRKACYTARKRWQKAKMDKSTNSILEMEEVYRARKKDLRNEI